MQRIAVIILAAGKGTRMMSKRQKILHAVGGKPMVQHVYEAARSVATVPPVLVVGPGGDGVRTLLGTGTTYVVQQEQLGTGHATMVCEDVLHEQADQVLVTYADMPLLRGETLQELVAQQTQTGAAVALLSVMGDASSSFGRIVRSTTGDVIEICEVAEAKRRSNSAEILAIRELNAGVYCFSASFLWRNIHQLPLRQARSGQEYYLTDLVEFAVQQNAGVVAITTHDPDECLGAGTRAEMVHVERAFRQRATRRWLNAGITLVAPDQTYIDPDVTIGQDTIIWPNSYLQGDAIIGEDCVIGPNAIVRSAVVGDRCTILQAVVESVIVPPDTPIAPFAHVHPLTAAEHHCEPRARTTP
jgi:bifunctional UDP-N-acetylglucosamine pyrophosphorylase/glucosamine-1-phosphate N-acetyltransferase